jgi:hypothetical protein
VWNFERATFFSSPWLFRPRSLFDSPLPAGLPPRERKRLAGKEFIHVDPGMGCGRIRGIMTLLDTVAYQVGGLSRRDSPFVMASSRVRLPPLRALLHGAMVPGAVQPAQGHALSFAEPLL